MKEIRFSQHSQIKIEVLANHEIRIDLDFVVQTVRYPDSVEVD